ncbi:hypothetical protein Bca4012_021870 [Brassica carinata]
MSKCVLRWEWSFFSIAVAGFAMWVHLKDDLYLILHEDLSVEHKKKLRWVMFQYSSVFIFLIKSLLQFLTTRYNYNSCIMSKQFVIIPLKS